ncbi:MAG: two-component system response regulator NreC [Colwellia sp.]|jgi:DNA-binding NarL/FixJ family response regulator
MSISLVVADDHVLMRQALVNYLKAGNEFTILAECKDGIELISQTLKTDPDVVVMDISMPNMSGLVAIDKLLSQRPTTKILVLSMHDELEYILAMQKAGAKGYILKESSSDLLIHAIKDVYNGKTFFPNLSANNCQPASNPLEVLTRREREVFFSVIAGNTSKNIAELLNMSVKTVENHRTKIYKKLQVGSVAELLRMANKAGLLE